MKRILCRTFAFVVFCAAAFAQQAALPRPKITGIDHVDFYTTSPDANQHLYAALLGLRDSPPIETGQVQRYLVGSQWVGYSIAPDSTSKNRMDHVAFRTDDCEGLRAYLGARGVKVPDSLNKWKDGSRNFQIKDPEGNVIEFVQWSGAMVVKMKTAVSHEPVAGPDPVSSRLIHVGFIVRDREAEDRFYKDVLGFRLYWHGGMQPDKTDWVAMQLPDGTDWLEYMLNVDAKPSLQLTGVMNHVSLGVRDMKQAQGKLEAHGWKARDDEHAQMGKDGKWQLNIYDPDLTRIELMDFRPTEKPCCSEFQGPHPQGP